MRLSVCILSAIILISLLGCTQPKENTSHNTTKPDGSKTGMEILSDGNNTFAFDLYHTLKENSGNLFYSPYSISSALAMTYAGARGETEKQMADTLHFTLPQDRLHPAFNSLSQALASRGQESEIQNKKGFILRNVNALWGRQDYKFVPAFLKLLDENYGAGLKTLNFAQEPEESRLTINNCVSEQTEDRIKDLIPSGSIDGMTRLILTNAIYFKANWLFQFNDSLTGNGQFNLLDGGKVTVPMMNQTEYFAYTKGSGYQAVELPYQGRQLSMVIMLPDKGKFDTFEDSLEYARLQKITGNLKGEEVSLTMPKFAFTSDFRLKPTLSDMGMPDAFSGNADFSGITEEENIWIGDIFHKAFVAVDENGTEAAAATAVIMPGAAPGEPLKFTMDRPFIFLIRDIETNTILFMGRVLNPLG
jgi:serpin B